MAAVVATEAESRLVTIEHRRPSLMKATVASNLPRFTASSVVVLVRPSATIKARTIAAAVAFVAARRSVAVVLALVTAIAVGLSMPI